MTIVAGEAFESDPEDYRQLVSDSLEGVIGIIRSTWPLQAGRWSFSETKGWEERTLGTLKCDVVTPA